MIPLKWNGKEFKFAGRLLNSHVFSAWAGDEGRRVFEAALSAKRFRWFFGRWRVRRALFADAKRLLRPGQAFPGALKETLDEFPMLLRKLGIVIKRKAHRDLFSADGTKALVVVPRGVMQHEFTVFLIDKLAAHHSLSPYPGLARRIVREAAIEAEKLFFKAAQKGRAFVIPGGDSVILDVDPEYGWRLNGIDGHYYCAYAGKTGKDLNKRGDLRRFRSEMDEVLKGQRIYLKRLTRREIESVAGAFRAR
jgi:hypothetical protein